MFEVLLLLFILLAICFAGVVFVGAPYVPTHQSAINDALNLLNLKPDELLLELGAGDGRVLVGAASRGWRVIGYEINPFLWLVAKARTIKHRSLVSVRLADYKSSKWPSDVRGVYLFGSKTEMTKILAKINSKPHKQPITFVSYGFRLKEQQAADERGGFVKYIL